MDSTSSAQGSCISLKSRTRRVFEESSIGQLIAEFLSLYEVRQLLLHLSVYGFELEGFFHQLCTRSLSPRHLRSVLNRVLHRKGAISSPWEKKDGGEVSSLTLDTPQQRAACGPLYSEVYIKNVYGRVCDECNDKMRRNEVEDGVDGQSSSPSTSNGAVDAYGGDRSPLPELSLPQSAYDSTAASLSDFSVLRISAPVICDKCVSTKVLPTSEIANDLRMYEEEQPLLSRLPMESGGDASLQPVFMEFGGSFVRRDIWDAMRNAWMALRTRCLSLNRSKFGVRLTQLLGARFNGNFAGRLFPPGDFLASYEKTRFYNCIKYLKPSNIANSRSRFKNGPLIERHPLGSIERATALRLKRHYEVWRQNGISILRVVAAERAMLRILREAKQVLFHPDHKKASDIIEEFILTHDVDRDTLDKKFLHAYWSILHHKQTGERRVFLGTVYDRERVARKLDYSLKSRRQALLPIPGYLGVSDTPVLSTDVAPCEDDDPEEAMAPQQAAPSDPHAYTTEAGGVGMSAAERLTLALQKAGVSLNVSESAAFQHHLEPGALKRGLN